MEPKTKLQKEVVKLSAKLPAISEKQINWFQSQMTKFFTRSRKSFYCLECGHKWFNSSVLITAIAGCACPNCKAELVLKDAYAPRFTESMYGAILTTKENKQVVRMIFITKYYSKRTKPVYVIEEVMQQWITPSGKITVLSIRVNSLSHYIDAWAHGTSLEVRGSCYTLQNKLTIKPYCIYPNRTLLPVIKRNGFRGFFHNFSPALFFQLILSNNKAETLLKTNQIPLLASMFSNPERINKYWKIIRICIRNKYRIADTSTWFDYLGFLEYFQKDLSNQKFVCPADLKLEHDNLLSKKRKIIAEETRVENLRKSAELQKVYAKEKRKYFGLKFTKGNISVNPLKTITEFYDEGESLKHCVFHSGYFKKKNSLILSAKINDIPVETIEVSLKTLEIMQARGMQNKITEYHTEIISLVQKNLSSIAKCK